MLPTVARKTGVGVHTTLAFSIERESHELSCLGWPESTILWISAPWIAWDDSYTSIVQL
jgi:hypothetical protein